MKFLNREKALSLSKVLTLRLIYFFSLCSFQEDLYYLATPQNNSHKIFLKIPSLSSQDPESSYQEGYHFPPEYEITAEESEGEKEVHLIRAQGLPYDCTEEDVLNFFSGNFMVPTGSH